MKALQRKASIARAFEKPEKRGSISQHQERILALEEKQIANQIGIDASEIDKCKWLFDLVKCTALPPRYSRILVGDEETGKVKYLDSETGAELINSPLLGLFKKTYYEKMDHSKAAYVFDQKSRKLLPFMQEKLSKERIGLASKRKQAEKVNLVRDEKGKVTTSKTTRIAPDTKKMLVSRDYLLKMIVDKVITKGQLFGKGKRAKQLSLTLEKSKNSKQTQEESRLMSDLPIDQVEVIYEEATQFYVRMFGSLGAIPKSVQQSKAYRSLTPQAVAGCIMTLGIPKQRMEEYWFGKMMNCLPLPRGWSERGGLSEEAAYLYEPLNIITSLHPSVSYISQQINEFRHKFSQLPEKQRLQYMENRQMVFIDFFQRSYKVDMFLFLSKKEESQERWERQEERVSQNQVAQTKINDWLIMEGAVVGGLQPQNYHLSQAIQDYFIAALNSSEVWHPQVSPYGEVVWTNTITGVCVSKCPIAKELQNSVKSWEQEIPVIEAKDYTDLYRFIQSNQFTRTVYRKMHQEKSRFVRCFVQREAFEYFPEFEGQQDLIFHCPFQFMSVFDDKLPAWMEKTINKTYQSFIKSAKKYTTSADHISILIQLIEGYAKILKKNKSWETYFKQTYPEVEPTAEGLSALITYIFDDEQRLRWLKFHSKKDQEKIVQELKQRYLEAHQPAYREPEVVVDPNPQQSQKQQEKESKQEESKSNQPTVPTKKYFNYENDDDYNYDKAYELIKAVKQWSQADSKDGEVKSKDIRKRRQTDHPMILCTDEDELNQQLRELKKKVNKTKKFSSSSLNTKLLQRINKTPDTYERIIYKNGLLKSNLKNEWAAMNRKSREKFLKRNGLERSGAQTSIVCKQDPEMNMFNSLCSEYTNTSLDKLIQLMKEDESRKPKAPERKQLSPSFKSSIMKQSIWNAPVEYPSILPFLKKKDSNFVHVEEADLDDFVKVFSRQKFSNTLPAKTDAKHKYNKSTDNLKATAKTLHVRSTSKIQGPANNEGVSPVKIRCLDKACGHLLNTNVVTSQVAFGRLEIRKELFAKNRGLKLINV